MDNRIMDHTHGAAERVRRKTPLSLSATPPPASSPIFRHAGNSDPTRKFSSAMRCPWRDVELASPLHPARVVDSRVDASAVRVLIYTTCYNVIDGVTLTIRMLEQAIVDSGGSVCILTTRSGSDANTNSNGLGDHPRRRVLFLDNAIDLPFLKETGDSAYRMGFSISEEIIEQIDDFGPTLVHVSVPDWASLCAIQYARDRRLPLMGTYHSNIVEYLDYYAGMGWIKPIVAAFFNHVYSFLQVLYVPTPYARKCLTDKYKMDQVTELAIFGRGIDLEKFSPKHRCSKFRDKLGVAPDEILILFVGRLVPEKRPDVFAEVIRRLDDAGAPFRAVVAGDGPALEELSRLPRTSCVGWVDSDDLPVLYASADVFLFPSGVETFGNVTLEAAASGVPLVIDAGCSGHLVDAGKNGCACVSGNADSFYQATRSLVFDRERRARCAAESRRVSLGFEKDYVMRQMVTNYVTVTQDFYEKYGGDHSNRDEAKTLEGSFYGGTFPKPMALYVLEYFFICLFKVIFCLVALNQWFQDVRLMSGFLWIQDRASMRQFSNHASTEYEDENIVEPVQPMLNSTCIQLTDQDVVQFGEMDLFKSCELGGSKSAKEGLQEDYLSSLPSVSETDDGVDPMEDDIEESRGSSCLLTSCIVGAGDSETATRLATLFTRIVLFVWRVEGRIRTFGGIARLIAGSFRRRRWLYWSSSSDERKKEHSDLAKTTLTETSSNESQDCIIYPSSRREDPCGRRIRSTGRLSAA